MPQAICHTIVPSSFGVLLSQRRRWINSTIHNLLELARVNELCGVLCLSMQFVVVIDLIGTVLLPGSTVLLAYFIVLTIIKGDIDTQSVILVLGTLGLPGFIVVFATGNFLYTVWLILYLLALPIWNFVLPVYAFLNFDNFSWGETRRVRNKKDKGLIDRDRGSFAIGSVPLKRYAQWEQERIEISGTAPVLKEARKALANNHHDTVMDTVGAEKREAKTVVTFKDATQLKMTTGSASFINAKGSKDVSFKNDTLKENEIIIVKPEKSIGRKTVVHQQKKYETPREKKSNFFGFPTLFSKRKEECRNVHLKPVKATVIEIPSYKTKDCELKPKKIKITNAPLNTMSAETAVAMTMKDYELNSRNF